MHLRELRTDIAHRFFANKKHILDQQGWDQRISVLFILTQRKMGKTHAPMLRSIANLRTDTFLDSTSLCTQ
jgi:hypothetical protein